MDIKKTLLNIIEWIKSFISDDLSCGSKRTMDYEHTYMDEMMAKFVKPEPPPLAEYEVRRKAIEESGEPIEGIFYLYNGQIIPDYYSECLFSDKHNLRREAMYHFNFHPDYMLRKFEGLAYGEKSLPRGRIIVTGAGTIIYIDQCYFNDAGIISRLIELYRLNGKIEVMTHLEYRCPACHDGPGRLNNYGLMSYTFCE